MLTGSKSSAPQLHSLQCAQQPGGGQKLWWLGFVFHATKRGFVHTKSTGHSSFNLCSKPGQKVKLVLRNMEIMKHVASWPTCAKLYCIIIKPKYSYNVKKNSVSLEIVWRAAFIWTMMDFLCVDERKEDLSFECKSVRYRVRLQREETQSKICLTF